MISRLPAGFLGKLAGSRGASNFRFRYFYVRKWGVSLSGLWEIMFSGPLKSGFPRRFQGDFRKYLAVHTKYVQIPTVPNAYVIRYMEKMRVDEHGKTGDLRAELVTKRRVRNLRCEIKKAISENVEMWRTA